MASAAPRSTLEEQVRRHEASDIKLYALILKHENARLKQMYADLSLENRALKDGSKKPEASREA